MAKTTIGGKITHESILIKHMATDEDGSVRTKLGEEFTDSKAYFDGMQAAVAAKVKGQ